MPAVYRLACRGEDQEMFELGLPDPEPVLVGPVFVGGVGDIVEFALEEEVVIKLPTVALVRVAERVDGVADG